MAADKNEISLKQDCHQLFIRPPMFIPTSQQVPLNTILKPNLRGPKRSVTKLTDNEVLQKASKYCLTSQELDTDGEVETKLFKVSEAAITTIFYSP